MPASPAVPRPPVERLAGTPATRRPDGRWWLETPVGALPLDAPATADLDRLTRARARADNAVERALSSVGGAAR